MRSLGSTPNAQICVLSPSLMRWQRLADRAGRVDRAGIGAESAADARAATLKVRPTRGRFVRFVRSASASWRPAGRCAARKGWREICAEAERDLCAEVDTPKGVFPPRGAKIRAPPQCAPCAEMRGNAQMRGRGAAGASARSFGRGSGGRSACVLAMPGNGWQFVRPGGSVTSSRSRVRGSWVFAFAVRGYYSREKNRLKKKIKIPH